MDPVLEAILRSWDFRPEVLIPTTLFLVAYTVGWVRLRQKSHHHQLATWWRLASYWAGMVCIWLALLSPMDLLSSHLLYFHMIQHIFLTMLGAPLIALGNPMPFLLWGIPAGLRLGLGNLLSQGFGRQTAGRKFLLQTSGPMMSLVIMTFVLWLWHDRVLYNTALTVDWVHDLEHLTFFLTTLLFWWHMTLAGPYIHQRLSMLMRVIYLNLATLSSALPGMVISFSTQVLYSHYTTAPRLPAPLGMSALDDQILAGVLMWVSGAMMYPMASAVIVVYWMVLEERKQNEKVKNLASIPQP